MERGEYTLFTDYVVDTYGGDFTYLDVSYNINEDGSYTFFEHYSGCGWISRNPDAGGEVTSSEKIEEYTRNLGSFNKIKLQIAKMSEDELKEFFNELKSDYPSFFE